MIHETYRSSRATWEYLVLLVATALHLQQSSAFTTPCPRHVPAVVRCEDNVELAAVPKKKLDYENYFDDLEKEEEEPQEPEQQPSLQEQLHDVSAEHDYTMVGDTDTTSPSSLSLDKIHRAIAARRSYQRKRDFRKADQILSALNRGGVFLHDKRREWRGDGVNSFGSTKRDVHYVRRGGNWDNYTNEEIDHIQSLIQQRRQCKHKRQFERADALEAELKVEYNVQIDDDRLEWSFASQQQHDYVHTPLVDEQDNDLDADTHDKIQQLVRERSLARANKDFRQADTLRDTLLEQYSVVMDDRTKEWKVVLDWKEEYCNDPFVVDARSSQRSAFAQSRDHHGTNSKKTNKRDEDLGDDDMDALSAAVDAVFAEREVAVEEFHQDVEQDEEQTNEGGQVEGRYASVDEIIAQEFAADDSQQIEEEEEQTNDEVVGAVALAADESEEAMIEEEQTIDEDIEELSAEVDAALAEEFASDNEQGRPIVQVLEEDEASLKALTVPVLKEKLRLQGLPVSGRKADLIDRLLSN
ncbi:expressed unknown protein [Seminavis robusta]|uniref:SAP domain-containing protein n=1 Tax=Seminavis robusta TaxID=568900 RepID=A0A9N8DWF7_9STRA|nr:expressed unknown protein [Seminavis robusta]|eukprot:Sro427_g140700.1 n/a (526) ;mRNA; f:45460-47037